MTRLAPNMFDKRFAQFVELGRSRLPSSAPAWTDHNAHDPGITLIELLAWVAEAQIYSLSKMRRDERQAYSALMGVEPHGARPASGLIWPDHGDPAGPAAAILRGRIIDLDAAIRLERTETPSFRPEHRQLWIPARIDELKSRLADGTKVDHLDANRRGGPAFHPFGTDENRDAVLRMTLAATGPYPLFEPGRPDDARLIVGVRADAPPSGRRHDPVATVEAPIEVTLVAGGERISLPVDKDTTGGMLRTGYLALNVSLVDINPTSAVLEFRAPAGFARSPRILRIEPNVVPFIQKWKKFETKDGDGSPDQAFDLETPGIEFEPGSDPVRIDVEALGSIETWSSADRLDECGPGDRKFSFDPVAASVSFGNGVNGARPPANSKIHATYSVTEGRAGNIAANRNWIVSGFIGLFGSNPDPTSGGEDASGRSEQRRVARRSVQERHPLVSAKDFEEAALELTDLEVGRAWMVPPSAGDIGTGTMLLVVMRARAGDGKVGDIPESGRWLESVRRRLAPRVALGSRLRVIAPRYIEFTISAQLEAEPGQNPEDVRRHVIEQIAERLTVVTDKPGVRVRAFGLPVTRRDLTAWIQKLPDVRKILELTVRVPGGVVGDSVRLPTNGLPLFDRVGSEVQVVRGGSGDAR